MQKRHLDDTRYFQELAETTRKYLMPFIESVKPIEAGMKILEIGCGVGGNLLPFRERGCSVTGVDIHDKRIESAQRLMKNGEDPKVRILCSDIFDYETKPEYDILLIHDVIEHIYDKERFLAHVKGFLKPGGVVFIAFPAWQMPFGGHQQIGKSKFVSHFPFLHLLPNPLYRGYLKMWKERKDCIDELLDIKRCKTSTEYFKRLSKKNGFKVMKEQFYFINPHYEIKFGLKPRKLSKIISAIPYFRNFCTTSCFYLIG